MVKISRYKKQTGVTPKAPNTYSQIRFNPSDYSRASDAIGQLGSTSLQVGMDLLQQQESNKSRKAEQLSNQEMKMLETLEKQKTDFDVLKIKMDRANLLHEKMDFAINGTADTPGLNSWASDYLNNPDYKNNEENFSNVAEGMKQSILATIDDEVVKRDFGVKFDNKASALQLDVMNGSFKTGLAQRTAAYKSEHKELLYQYQFGNIIEQKTAKDRLLGLNGVVGIHEEAFDGGIINTTKELAEQFSVGEIEFVDAQLMIAKDPEAYLALAEGKSHDYPFKNLTLEQRGTLDIKAFNAVETKKSQAEANLKKMIKENAANVKEITDKLDDGIMIENGLIDLGTARAIATDLGDAETVKNIDNYMNMWGTFQIARQSNPLDLDAKIRELQDKINYANTLKTAQVPPGETGTQGVLEKDLLELKALTTIKNKMETALTKDSLKWSDQVGKISLDRMDLNADEETWKKWVSNRQGDSDQTAAIYGTKQDFLTREEQSLIMNFWQDDETTLDQKIQLIARLSSFGEDADNVFAEILVKGDGKKESHYFAHIAGLMNSNPNNPIIGELAVSFFNGFAKREDFSNPATQMLLGEEKNEFKIKFQNLFNAEIDGAFIHADPAMNKTIFDMANLIYLDKAPKSTVGVKEELYKNIINELIGGTTVGGVSYGGIVEYNKQSTYAPPWMKSDEFEEIINNLYEEEFLLVSDGQVPIWNNGDQTGEFKLKGDVFNRDFDPGFIEGKVTSYGSQRRNLGNYNQPYLWVVGDGRYLISFNKPFDNEDPQYLATKNNDNGYFVLDLNKIKDLYLNGELMSQKYPEGNIQ